jgi:hypothetical protein
VDCKPVVRLVGSDGSAFAVLAACRKAAKKAGWSVVELLKFQEEAKSGDYDHLLQTACKYFEVE